MPGSLVLNFLRKSHLLSWISRNSVAPAREAITLHFARAAGAPHRANPRTTKMAVVGSFVAARRRALLYAIAKMTVMLATISRAELHDIVVGAGATFLRVELTLVLAALWTIPVGVYIGLKPKLAAIAQPIAQIAASVPAPALFPIVLLVLIRSGRRFVGIASILLLLLGTPMVHPL